MGLLWAVGFLLWETNPHLPGEIAFLQVGKPHGIIMGSGIFIMGGHPHLLRGTLHFCSGKSMGLLWAVGFLLWEATFTFLGEIAFLQWENHGIIMGSGIFIMGDPPHLPGEIAFLQSGKSTWDYYGQWDFYYGRPPSPSRGNCIPKVGKAAGIIMGSSDFYYGRPTSPSLGLFAFLGWEKHADYYGQGDFYHGRPPSTPTFAFPGKSKGLLWALGFLLWEGHLHLSRGSLQFCKWEKHLIIMGSGIFIMGGQLSPSLREIAFLGWEKQGIIMGSGIFIMGGHPQLPGGLCISGVGKAWDYYGQWDFYFGRPPSPSRGSLHF